MTDQSTPSFHYPAPAQPEPVDGTAFKYEAPEDAAPVPAGSVTGKRVKPRYVAGAVALALLVGVGAFAYHAITAPNILELAHEKCSAGRVGDDGQTLAMKRVGAKEDPGQDDFNDYQCVVDQLSTPDHVKDHMGATRSVDGMQTDEWNDIKARWNYYPENGLDMTFTIGG